MSHPLNHLEGINNSLIKYINALHVFSKILREPILKFMYNFF